MISIFDILALGALVLAIWVPFAAAAIQLARLIWFITGDKETRGRRPRFTGLVVAMFFSALAATELLSVEPFPTLSYLNPVPQQYRVEFMVAMLALALAGWIWGGSIRNRVQDAIRRRRQPGG
ncbi:hypothetical protein [Achromobacter anxifer]|jgi:hypothetical protein|uniref:Transmembrane protein n=1 Tax=Achromobacter anxifer TaxID=1287737 RepID=A0A6S7F3D3_9BURK|nr:hypothetical protein [Achromobacter anxifer]MDF8361071.1 hypothetical protein [Achromobacter anxifer]CAB3928410.1 hypothetical protein LMG26858_06220 [Achromobacter anxifer]